MDIKPKRRNEAIGIIKHSFTKNINSDIIHIESDGNWIRGCRKLYHCGAISIVIRCFGAIAPLCPRHRPGSLWYIKYGQPKNQRNHQ